MREPYKNPNSNARFAAAGFCAAKFSERGVKFFALQNARFFAKKFSSTKFCGVKFNKAKSRRAKFYAAEFTAKGEKFCGAEPKAHDVELRGFKFRDEKFCGANFATYGTEFLKTNFYGMEFCKSKFRARGAKFYKAELRETCFFARTAKFYTAKFHGAKFSEMGFRTPNLEFKTEFNALNFAALKFRDALFKFAAAKGLRRSHSLCTAAPFKFTALQNAGFFATKFGEAEFCDVKFHKERLRRARFYGAEFAAKDEKFCGMKRRGVGA